MSDHPRHHYGLLHRFRHRHRVLLGVLVGFILLLPAVDAGFIPAGLASLGFTFIVVPSVLATGRNARRIVVGIALASPCVLVALISLLTDTQQDEDLRAIYLISMSVFLAYTVFAMIKHLFRTSNVSEEILASAVGVYMLVAFLFSALFQLLAVLEGSVISGIEDPYAFSDFVYFSFMNQTTVGFGEMVPVTSFARTLSILQAVGGQMYLVVLLARLVGLHLTHRDSRGGTQ